MSNNTVDQAVDAIADIYWEMLASAIAEKNINKIFDAAINLKATESTRVSMKEKYEGNH